MAHATNQFQSLPEAKQQAPFNERDVAADDNIHPWFAPLLVFLTLAVYFNGLFGPFVFDDIQLIENDPRAQQLFTWKHVKGTERTERPLVFYTLALNYAVGRYHPFGYHLLNVIVHALAALALMGLVRRTLLLPRFGEMFRDSAAPLAFAAAALWAVHPLNTEAVTYIVHRGESMMGMFALVLFYCTVRGAQSMQPGWYAAAALAGLLGFGCKQWMVAVPVVLFLYDRIMLGGSWRDWLVHRGAIYAVLAVGIYYAVSVNIFDIRKRIFGEIATATASAGEPTLVSTSALATTLITTPPASQKDGPESALQSTEFEYGAPRRYSSLEYLRTQPGVVVKYLTLVVWPYPQCVDYFWPLANTPERIVPPALFLGTLMLVTCWALWRYPPWGFLGAAFFLLLAPSSSIASIEDMASERRMYLPLVPLVVLLVVSVWALLGWLVRRSAAEAAEIDRRRRIGGAILLAISIVAWGALTILRNFDYVNDKELWQRVVEQVPHNSRARVNLVRALLNEATDESHPRKHDDLCLELLKEAEAVSPKGPYVQMQIGHIRVQQAAEELQYPTAGSQARRARYLREAEQRFRRALDLDDRTALFHYNLAALLEKKGTLAAKSEALEHFEQAVTVGKNTAYRDAKAHLGVARLRVERGEFAKAIAEYREALELEPRQIDIRLDLAEALARTGEINEAIAEAETAKSMAEKSNQDKFAKQADAQLKQYRSSKR